MKTNKSLKALANLLQNRSGMAERLACRCNKEDCPFVGGSSKCPLDVNISCKKVTKEDWIKISKEL